MRTHALWILCLGALIGLAVQKGAPVQAQGTDGPTVMAEGKELASGSTYIIPGHSEANSLALFSESVQVVSLYNKTGKVLTVNKVEVAVGEGMKTEEFTLLKDEIKRAPLGDVTETVADGKNWGFKVRFYPVESGVRAAKITVTYNTDKTYELNLQGRGRGETKFFSHGATALHKLFGSEKTDEMLSGAVGGPDGSIYFTGEATQIADKFSTDIFWGKVNADGTLAWAQLWNGKYMDRSPDSGQNAETGGTSGSLAVDAEGNLYLCGETSPASYNSNFAALVIKVDGKTGQPLWEQQWRPEWATSLIARQSAAAYALTVRDGTVYVTGVTAGDAEVVLLQLNAADGTLKSQFSFDPTPGSNDRGYTIVAHEGAVSIGGLANGQAFVARIDLSGDKPKVAWSKLLDMGRGSNVNCLDTDNEGNLYASCDRRGATTFFSAVRINKDGSFAWGKTCTGTAGDRNNTHLVRVIGDTVYVGGRLGASGLFDTASGDGLLLALNTADGAEKWTAFYYTGTGPDEAGEHRIKGVAISGDTLTVVGQGYTGSRNGERYWGYWYNGVTGIEDYKPEMSDLGVAEDAVKPVEKGSLKPAADARTLVDLKDKLDWIDADAKTGQPSDGDISVWQIKLK
ncbi:MAG: PQQ-like beta-propeller repeat protein [Planctomycetes bacterium]|nr:PQQ-like beta-propeller repeat protein [Planctomycetota bacterium]